MYDFKKLIRLVKIYKNYFFITYEELIKEPQAMYYFISIYAKYIESPLIKLT